VVRVFSKLLIVWILFSIKLVAWKLEADTMVVKNTTNGVITHINFRQTYETVPLVFTLATDAGGNSATIRVNSISKTGFDVYSVEPDGNDGSHVQMSAVPYIVIEEGSHEFPDGTKIVAGKISTNKFQSKLIAGASWEFISLSGFSTTPIVLGEIQTRNSERTDVTVPDAVSQPWITTTISAVSSTGFEIALERSETQTGTLVNEDIAYLAIDSGLNGGNHYFGSSEAKKIEYETILSSDSIRGWDDSSIGYLINFSKAYSDPMVVTTKNTRDGGDGGWFRRRSIATDSIALVVDEDKANDTERSHTTEKAGVLLFSEPFDVEFIDTNQASMMINEVMYNETVTGSSNNEFVEFYVTQAGDLNGLIVADQDTNEYLFPSHTVAIGDYVVLHTGIGTDTVIGRVHHFYKGASQIWNNTNDDVLLLQPAKDLITLADGQVFNAIPIDYTSYGRNSVGGNVDPIPTSLNGVTLTWDYSYGTELDNALDGQSISLSPNNVDSNKAGCWELTASGNASDNGCSGYLITTDSEADTSLTYSMGQNNTVKPNIFLTKNSTAIYDPINLQNNPKAIPGAMVKYVIDAHNEGNGATDSNTAVLKDTVPANMKMCVATVAQCQEVTFIDGTTTSGLSLGTVSYSNDGGANYNYTPTADAEGFDATVTNVKFSLDGAFLASDGVNYPSMQLEFFMGVN
jgi:hypothetical protein